MAAGFLLLAQEPSYVLSSTDLAAVPLFLLNDVFASMAGFPRMCTVAAAAFIGHRRGELAFATIGGSAGFVSISGPAPRTRPRSAASALPQYVFDRG